MKGKRIVLTTICIVVLIGGFWLYKADNHQKSDRYYTDENGIQREVKFLKINNYLYYDGKSCANLSPTQSLGVREPVKA